MVFKVVVPISGGKDSQACLKLALLEYPPAEILGLFCDTQFEHPLTYLHIETMRRMYGVEIRRISAGSVPEMVIKRKRFPGGGARHCTKDLKIIPSKKFYRDLAAQQGGFQVWYGVRLDESPQRTKRYAEKINTELYAPHEFLNNYPKYLGKMGVVIRLPVLDMTKGDVLEICNGEQNPLYFLEFDRVGCFPCLAAGDAPKEKAFAFDSFGAQQRVIVLHLAKEINHSIFNSKGGKSRNLDFEGCAICAI